MKLTLLYILPLIAIVICLTAPVFSGLPSFRGNSSRRRRRKWLNKRLIARWAVFSLLAATVITLIWPALGLPDIFQGAAIAGCLFFPVFIYLLLAKIWRALTGKGSSASDSQVPDSTSTANSADISNFSGYPSDSLLSSQPPVRSAVDLTAAGRATSNASEQHGQSSGASPSVGAAEKSGTAHESRAAENPGTAHESSAAAKSVTAHETSAAPAPAPDSAHALDTSLDLDATHTGDKTLNLDAAQSADQTTDLDSTLANDLTLDLDSTLATDSTLDFDSILADDETLDADSTVSMHMRNFDTVHDYHDVGVDADIAQNVTARNAAEDTARDTTEKAIALAKSRFASQLEQKLKTSEQHLPVPDEKKLMQLVSTLKSDKLKLQKLVIAQQAAIKSERQAHVKTRKVATDAIRIMRDARQGQNIAEKIARRERAERLRVQGDYTKVKRALNNAMSALHAQKTREKSETAT